MKSEAAKKRRAKVVSKMESEHLDDEKQFDDEDCRVCTDL